MKNIDVTKRTSLKRIPQRAIFDREGIYRIMDEGMICHVSFIVDGSPFVIPTIYGRKDDTLYIHGAKASRMLKNLQQGIEACISVTLLDGLVLARSAFHHSMNYRSVIIFGKALEVKSRAEKLKALKTISDHLVKGRWSEVRHPTNKELDATTVLQMPLTEISAKVRTGVPVDDAEDYNLPVWAGELPFRMETKKPIQDAQQSDRIDLPDYIRKYKR